jgi:hypothetical protein
MCLSRHIISSSLRMQIIYLFLLEACKMVVWIKAQGDRKATLLSIPMARERTLLGDHGGWIVTCGYATSHRSKLGETQNKERRGLRSKQHMVT